MSSTSLLHRRLHAIRRVARKNQRQILASKSLLALALSMLLALILAAVLPDSWAPFLWLLPLLALGFSGRLLWLHLKKQKAAWKSDAAVALWVESKHREHESILVTAVELSDAPLGLGHSKALQDEVQLRAEKAIESIDPKALIDPLPLKRQGLLALLFLLVLLPLLLLSPESFTKGWRQLSHFPALTGEELVEDVDLAVSQLSIQITPPEYTQLAPRTLPRSVGHFEALAGSKVTFQAQTLFPAKEAALILESQPENRWALKLDADGQLSGSLQIKESDRYRFALLLGPQHVVEEKAWREITAKPDSPPTVLLYVPEEDMEVQSDDTVEFFFEASDDIGLDQVDLVVEDAEGMEIKRETISKSHGRRIEKNSASLHIQELGRDPGDHIMAYFEAKDNNSLTGPGVGQSEKRMLSIFSPESEHMRILLELKKLLDDMIEVLADRLESPLDPSRRQALQPSGDAHLLIASKTEALLEKLQLHEDELEKDALSSEELKDAIRQLRQALKRELDQESTQLNKWVNERALVQGEVFMTLLEQSNKESIEILEDGLFRLKRFIDQALKDAILQAGKDMLDTQNEIMELLKQLKDSDDPALREVVIKKIQKLQEKLQELAQKLAELQERSPYENQNPAQRPSQRQEESQDLGNQMEDIQKLLEEGKIDEAMALLEELTKSTQAMMAGLEDDLDGIGRTASPRAQREADAMRQKLDELSDGQRGLQRETQETREDMAKEERERQREKALKELEALKDDARKLSEALEKAEKDGLHPLDQEALKGLQEEGQRLQEALEKQDLWRAKEDADKALDKANGLRNDIDKDAEREVSDKRLKDLNDAMKSLKEAEELAESISKRIAPSEDGDEAAPSLEEAKKLSQLGELQGGLKEQLSSLQEQLESLDGEAPGMKEALGEQLQKAQDAMGEAEAELQGMRPKDAEASQDRALQELQEAKSRLQQQMSQKPSSGEESAEGINRPDAKVGIPKDDPNLKARQLREDIIRAMKEKAPLEYEDSIKKFYEELTK